ncbi:3-hydroxybutyryl-CoA dehydratase-like protein [Pyrus ussuriensis x Pyrus communis]|uniref:3-hydroxybutyryl-CoA dehydratase-like protein n=1 Tax=Pyrus ussuriensis x Pyrus communis TaxID=2448454 RepID=A0A5N5F5E2_9ROSA|nr:3-hydroxybutyryl-CoA dehydratase-like protein [Pyrus ussuriensis x Pyrus communis]
MCTLERKGNIFILTLTGPGEHRLNPTLIDSIRSALNQVRAAVTTTATSSSPSALITTAHGKFFSNGYDLSWAQSSQSLPGRRSHLPPDAHHASAAGFILALSHDYLLMRRDRGFLYMSELDIELLLPRWFLALIESKVGSPAARRDLLLRADKVKADVAVAKGIIYSAHDSAEETVEAAANLGEELVRRKWNGHVYAHIRKDMLSDVLDVIRGNTTGTKSRL